MSLHLLHAHDCFGRDAVNIQTGSDLVSILPFSLPQDITAGTTKALGCDVTPAAASKIAGAVKSLANQPGGVEALAEQGALPAVSQGDCLIKYLSVYMCV